MFDDGCWIYFKKRMRCDSGFATLVRWAATDIHRPVRRAQTQPPKDVDIRQPRVSEGFNRSKANPGCNFKHEENKAAPIVLLARCTKLYPPAARQ